MNAPRNSIPALKLYNSPPFYHQHHEYFASRHNSTAAIMTPSVAGTASTAACSRRPEIIKVCSLIGYFYYFSLVSFCLRFSQMILHRLEMQPKIRNHFNFKFFVACRCVLFIQLCSTCKVHTLFIFIFILIFNCQTCVIVLS